MIYTLTFNPSLDYFVSVKNFRIGQVNRTYEENIKAGGKGINVSSVLKNLGHSNTALGFIAGFTGDELNKRLVDNGIQTDFINVKDGLTRINVKLRSNEESEINGRGPQITVEDVELLYQKLNCIKQNEFLILSGSIPEDVEDTIYYTIMERLRSKQIKIVVDATKGLLGNVLKLQPFLIKPNNHELGEIFGVVLEEKDEVIKYAKKLKEMGAQNVLVSMAAKGAVLITEDGRIYSTDAPKGILKNSVGAGDSMVAGFVAGYLETNNYKEAFKMGVSAGSASAFSEELATKEEILHILKSHQFNME